MEVTGPVCRSWATKVARDEADVGGVASIDAKNPAMADASAAAVVSEEVAAIDLADLQEVEIW